MRRLSLTVRRMAAAGFLGLGVLLGWTAPSAAQPVYDGLPVYPTFGTHNPPEYSNCANEDCVYTRGADEPTDPEYPEYWTSNWNMYTVRKGYEKYAPPYDGKPPAPLKDGVDYQTSTGTTYYDSKTKWPWGNGAMMEYYKDYCLPIFPIDNKFSCAFVSLGNKAWFLAYEEGQKKGMPPCCQFSNLNHPPARDFIKHLPYSDKDSKRIGTLPNGSPKLQGYSFWVDDQGKPAQVGVLPDQTRKKWIMFGYAFNAVATPDAAEPNRAPYRHPQSFYFSGSTDDPPNAPIVSQNYTDFAARKPVRNDTWEQVARMCAPDSPPCELFNPPKPPKGVKATESNDGTSWNDIPAKTQK